MTPDEHIALALHNEDVVKKLSNKPLEMYDWAITVMFYCTLHFVDAYLIKTVLFTPESHTAIMKNGKRRDGRNDSVKKYIPLLSSNFNMLYDASRKARYEGAYRTPQSVGNFQKLYGNDFTPLRQFFRQHLKR